MAISTALPTRVPSREQPSFFNREMGLGIVLGTLAGAAAWFALPTVLPWLGITATLGIGGSAFVTAAGMTAMSASLSVGALLGGIIGGAAGHARMQEEKVKGVPVRQPSFFNRDMFSLPGLAIAISLIGDVALLAIKGAPATAQLFNQNIVSGFGLADGISLAVLGGSAIIGGLYGKGKQAAVYHQAEQIAAANSVEIDKGRGLSPTLALNPAVGQAPAQAATHPYTISAEEQARLNARLEAGDKPASHFTDKVAANRSVAAEPTLV